MSTPTHRSTTDSAPFVFNLDYCRADYDKELWERCIRAGVLVPIPKKGGKAKGVKNGDHS